jgi:oxygen-dependent protoporphyrinogen oxidase
MVEALLSNLSSHNADSRLNSRVMHINQRYMGFEVQLEDGTTLESDFLILATPAYTSGQLLAALDPQLGFILQSILYVSTATISLAYRLADVPRDLDGYGYVIPRREGRKALACTWTSTKFPHRAPDGYALLRVFVGRAGQEFPWDEQELLGLAKQELQLTLGVTADPLVSRVFRWDKAMPQYNLGHPERLKRIDAALEHHPDLALAGNGYRGIGIPDCIHSGELAVERILSFIHSNVQTQN